MILGFASGFIAIAVSLVLLALSLHRNHSEIEKVVHEIVATEEPMSAAAYEMEINALGAGLGVQKYLATGDHQHRRRVLKDDADFRRFRQHYGRLARTVEEREFGRRLDLLYEKYLATGQRLMDTRDERSKVYTTVIEGYAEVHRILDQELEPLFDRDSRSGSGKLRRVISIEGDVASMAAWLGMYIATSDPVHRSFIFKNVLDAQRRFESLREHSLSPVEEERASAAERRFHGTRMAVDQAVALADSTSRDLEEFTLLRNGIDDLLDEGIQTVALVNLKASSAAARAAISRLNTASLAVVGIALVVSLLSSVAITRRSTQLASTNQELRVAIARVRASETARELGLKHLVSAQEEERRRLARELHDQMGQHLSALMLGLKRLSSRSGRPVGEGDSGPALLGLQDLTGRLIDQVHTIAWDLRPAALDDIGLTGALNSYVEEWERISGVKVDFLSRMECVRLSDPVETTLYRVAQEALTNVLKHAQARSVSILLESIDREVLLVIEDDGVGFDPNQTFSTLGARGHFGLLGMRERAILSGGSLEVEAAPGAGSTLVVRIPILAVHGEITEEGA